MLDSLNIFKFPDTGAVTTLGDVCDRGGGDVLACPFGIKLHTNLSAINPTVSNFDILLGIEKCKKTATQETAQGKSGKPIKTPNKP